MEHLREPFETREKLNWLTNGLQDFSYSVLSVLGVEDCGIDGLGINGLGFRLPRTVRIV